jgi:transposase, IS5 family
LKESKMRQTRSDQLPLLPPIGSHQHARQMERISRVLDQKLEIAALAHADLLGEKRSDVGRDGLSADQVVRIAVLQRIHRLTYRALEFHLIDSSAFRRFTRLGLDETPSKSVLQANVKRLSPWTWEAINRKLLEYARAEGIEDGRKIRGDCSAVEANIHEPSDSGLLWDGVRVVTRLLNRVAETFPEETPSFHDHTRVAKKLAYTIAFPSKNKNKARNRKRAYGRLVRVAERTYGYGREAERRLLEMRLRMLDDRLVARQLAEELGDFLDLLEQAIGQTRRRVLEGEQVLAADKVLSLFEPHAVIIAKENRKVVFGHKVCLTAGASSLILDGVDDGREDDRAADGDLRAPAAAGVLRRRLCVPGEPDGRQGSRRQGRGLPQEARPVGDGDGEEHLGLQEAS